MKRFLLRIVLFFFLVASFDVLFGKICVFLLVNAKGGSKKCVHQAALVQDSEIVIMGSSRAHHHYHPAMFTDTLGKSSYNAGVDGNGIVLANGLRCLIYSRYNPSIILYDLTPGFDVTINSMDGNNMRYLGSLRPYYNNTQVRKILSEVDFLEIIKNLSSMFRYNSSIIELLKDQVIVGDYTSNGYSPLYGTITQKSDDLNSIYKTGDPAISIMGDNATIDSLKYKMLEDYVSKISNTSTRLVFIVSPRWNVAMGDAIKPVKQLCDYYGVEFWDYSNDSEFQKLEYFKDRIHLNDLGARVFSSTVAHRLKQ